MSNKTGEKLETGGGAVVQGSVTAQRDFVGRDAYYGYTAEQVRVLIAELRHSDQPKSWDGRVPFKGLSAFREGDAHFFFGREALVATLLARVTRARFLCVSGPSGSGKSSLLRAGLLHALSQGRLEGSEHWLVADLTPQRAPLEQLAQAMARAARDPNAAAYLRARGATDPLALHTQAETLLSSDPSQRLVVFVDQFEELFTHVHGEGDKARERRAHFVAQLIQGATHPEGRVTVLMAVRADFIAQCATYPALREQMSREFQLVGALAPEELARAITLPVLEVGATIEPELVAQVIADMKGEPGALPLMQFALRDLFLASAGRMGESVHLSLQAYLERGGVNRALERHANATLAALDAGQRDIARAVFTRVVEPGQGQADTRRLAALEELASQGSDASAVRAVVQILADEKVRILTTGYYDEDSERETAPILLEAGTSGYADTVTLAHERLIDAWPWLRRLIDENRALIATQNRIAEDAREWEAHEREPSYVYTGARLAEAEELTEAGRLQLGDTGAAFVEAGLARQRAAARRRRVAVAGLAALTVVAVVAALFAFTQARRATARLLAADARLAAEEGAFRVAVLLASEAERREPEGKGHAEMWRDVLASGAGPAREIGVLSHDEPYDILYDDPGSLPVDVSGNKVYKALWSPGGDRLALRMWDGTIHIWDMAHGRIAVLPGNSATSDVTPGPTAVPAPNSTSASTPDQTFVLVPSGAVWAPEGHHLATLVEGGSVRIWDITRGAVVTEIDMSKVHAGMPEVVWSPDGDHLLARDEVASIWDLNGEQIGATFEPPDGFIMSIFWGSDGVPRVLTLDDARLHVWDARDGTRLATLADPPAGMEHLELVAWYGDGTRLALGVFLGGPVYIWDTGTEKLISAMSVDLPLTLAWSADGRRLAAGGEGAVQVWEAGRELITLKGGYFSAENVSWHPEGNRLALVVESGEVRIWEVGPPPLTLITTPSEVQASEWSPHGTHLAVDAEQTRIWDARSGAARVTLTDPERPDKDLYRVAWNPAGDRLATGSPDGEVYVWDAGSGALLDTLEGHTRSVHNVAWNPAGDRLAASSQWSAILRIWDADDWSRPLMPLDHESGVKDIVWNPDGLHLASIARGKGQSTLYLWDVKSGRRVAGGKPVTGGEGTYGQVYNVQWGPEGKRIAVVVREGTEDNGNSMQVSDLTTDISLILLRTPHDLASSILGWSPDGVYRAAAMEEERVHVWDDASGETVAILEGRGGKVRGIAWSPDSVYLAVVKESQLTYIWEAANGKMVAVLKGRGSEVHEIAWSPDGAYLAVAEEGQLAHIWEAASGETLPVFDSHSNVVSYMKWSADGDYLVTVDIKLDMNSQLNPEVSGDTVQIRATRYFSPPCEWLQSNLTVAEWRRYRGERMPYRQVCRNLPTPELPPFGAALKTFIATRGRVNYLLLTYQGWAVVIGVALLALATMVGAGVLVIRLGKHALQRTKSEKQVSGPKRRLNILNR